MNSASLCSQAGRYDNPIPNRCQAPIDFLKFPALSIYWRYLSVYLSSDLWNCAGIYGGQEPSRNRVIVPDRQAGWQNRFLGIDSRARLRSPVIDSQPGGIDFWDPETFTNTGSGLLKRLKIQSLNIMSFVRKQRRSSSNSMLLNMLEKHDVDCRVGCNEFDFFLENKEYRPCDGCKIEI